MAEIILGIDEGATGFGHLLPVDGHETMHEHSSRCAIARTAEHRRPEQRMEVDDILADEMIQLGIGAWSPIVIELVIGFGTQGLEAGHITHWGIEPHIEIFARRIGNLEAKIRGVATNIPLLQTAIQPLAQFIRD